MEKDWISVKDGLPHDHQRVIAAWNDGYVGETTCSRPSTNNWLFWTRSANTIYPNDVMVPADDPLRIPEFGNPHRICVISWVPIPEHPLKYPVAYDFDPSHHHEPGPPVNRRSW